MHAFMVTIREWNLRQRTAGQMLYQLSYIPALSVYKKKKKNYLVVGVNRCFWSVTDQLLPLAQTLHGLWFQHFSERIRHPEEEEWDFLILSSSRVCKLKPQGFSG